MNAPTPYLLETFEALCGAAHALSRLIISDTKAVLRPSPAQLLVLRALDCAGQPFNIGDLARRLGCSRPNASTMVARLVHVGWVARIEDLRNRRERYVAITEQGRWVLDTAVARVAPALDEAIGMLDARQQRTLVKYLRRISHAAGRHEMEMDPIALGRAEMGPAHRRRDEIAERNRRAYLGALKMYRAWGLTLDEMRAAGYYVPERLDTLPTEDRRGLREPPESDGTALWNEAFAIAEEEERVSGGNGGSPSGPSLGQGDPLQQ
jgi:DNA-binding MarR family transcriptional regulator